MSLRETYDLPERPPVPFWQWMVMLAAPVLSLVLWRLLPDSPITVALLAIALLAAIFIGVSLVLRNRQLAEPSGRASHPAAERDAAAVLRRSSPSARRPDGATADVLLDVVSRRPARRGRAHARAPLATSASA